MTEAFGKNNINFPSKFIDRRIVLTIDLSSLSMGLFWTFLSWLNVYLAFKGTLQLLLGPLSPRALLSALGPFLSNKRVTQTQALPHCVLRK